jgi:hypothetical protein
MFPLMNHRQHQALVQSALQKINLYQQKQKQILEQIERQKTNLENLEQPKIETEIKNRRQSLAEFKLRSELRRTIQQPIVIEEVPIVDENPIADENPIVDESIVFTMNEDSDTEMELLSEAKQELTEAIQKQTEIESNLIAENAELKEQFVAKFVKEEPKEEEPKEEEPKEEEPKEEEPKEEEPKEKNQRKKCHCKLKKMKKLLLCKST